MIAVNWPCSHATSPFRTGTWNRIRSLFHWLQRRLQKVLEISAGEIGKDGKAVPARENGNRMDTGAKRKQKQANIWEADFFKSNIYCLLPSMLNYLRACFCAFSWTALGCHRVLNRLESDQSESAWVQNWVLSQLTGQHRILRSSKKASHQRGALLVPSLQKLRPENCVSWATNTSWHAHFS